MIAMGSRVRAFSMRVSSEVCSTVFSWVRKSVRSFSVFFKGFKDYF